MHRFSGASYFWHQKCPPPGWYTAVAYRGKTPDAAAASEASPPSPPPRKQSGARLIPASANARSCGYSLLGGQEGLVGRGTAQIIAAAMIHAAQSAALRLREKLSFSPTFFAPHAGARDGGFQRPAKRGRGPSFQSIVHPVGRGITQGGWPTCEAQPCRPFIIGTLFAMALPLQITQQA